jgi:hypothetical protein
MVEKAQRSMKAMGKRSLTVDGAVKVIIIMLI